MGSPDDDAHRQVFLDNLLGGHAAQLSLGPGVGLCPLNAGTQLGLALQIQPEALHAGQLERVLERRFEQALAFDGCYVYVDAKGAVVVWHALPAQPAAGNALDNIISTLLSLANLQALDVHRYR